MAMLKPSQSYSGGVIVDPYTGNIAQELQFLSGEDRVSCFIYRFEEAKACDKWSTFVKIELNESFIHLRKRFAIEDYGGLQHSIFFSE